MNEWMWVQLLYSLQQKLFLFVSLIELDMVLMSLIFVALLLCTFKPMILQWQFETWVFSSCFSTKDNRSASNSLLCLPVVVSFVCLSTCVRARVCACALVNTVSHRICILLIWRNGHAKGICILPLPCPLPMRRVGKNGGKEAGVQAFAILLNMSFGSLPYDTLVTTSAGGGGLCVSLLDQVHQQLRARRDKRAQDIAHIHGVCSWQHDCPELDSWVSYAVVLFSFAVSNWQWKAANVRWPASGLSWVTLCVELFSHRIQWRRIPLNPKAI